MEFTTSRQGKKLIVSVGALNQRPMDGRGNFRRIVQAIESAKRQNAELLVLPELCITGFGCRNLFRRKEVAAHAAEIVQSLLPYSEGIALTLGFPLEFQGNIYNALAWVQQGSLLAVQCKTELLRRHFPEERWFAPWESGKIVSHSFLGQTVPLGDFPVIDCESPRDQTRYRISLYFGDSFEDSGRTRSGEPVDFRVFCSASPFQLGKLPVRRNTFESLTRDRSGVVLFSNLLGCESGRYIYDGNSCVVQSGTVLAACPPFSFEEVNVASTTVGLDSPDCRAVPFRETEKSVYSSSGNGALLYSLSLGLFDYLRKSRAKGFVLSLSGGADSACIAVVAALCVRIGVAELGVKRFLEKLDYIPNLSECETPEQIIGALLTCVYQGTENSGETTRGAARALAEELGARFHEIEIGPLVAAYRELIAPLLGRPLSWEKDDLALQNIQVRARVPGIWLLANLKDALLLNTGNRSEATLGYMTADGDSCGGFAPLGGIDKPTLQRWLKEMESPGPMIGDRFLPIRALEHVNKQQPTAELRPRECNQSDETDLMPYPLLNRIERFLLLESYSVSETGTLLQREFPQYDPGEIRCWLDRFIERRTRNQWKRKKAANYFPVDDSPFDPTDWEQFPLWENE